MAIGYARVEFVKRSSGKTSCAKAAYNSRTKIEFFGNCTLDPETFNWSGKEPSAYHEVLLPLGVNEKFKSLQVLWNAVEVNENRSNSQVAIDLLLALPDDKVLSLKDRVYLAKTFVQAHFVDKGLAAQIDIHPPEKRIRITRDNREIGVYKEMLGNVLDEKGDSLTVQFDSKRIISFNPKEFTGFIETENNWHAHVLVTTRRFKKDGLDLGAKARDLMPRICKGRVVAGEDWGKIWTDHQNNYFQEKGMSLRVDSPGIEPQEHLGPVRMRGRAFDLLEEHSQIQDRNFSKAKSVGDVLDKITERQSVFSKQDVDHFIQKHLPAELHTDFKERFWKQEMLVPLINKETGEETGKFSTQKVMEEEASILRLADKIYSRDSFQVDVTELARFSKKLTGEQQVAFSAILHGKKMACIQGYAGTGKSYLLSALGAAYSHAGYRVRAFGPDNASSQVLKEKGFLDAENIYRFLYCFHHSKRKTAKNDEVWILDEAGKLGNRPLLEFLKAAYNQKAQVVFCGDHAQLFSVDRGGMFRVFCERYETPVLKDIQRQKEEGHREISKSLALGEIGSAIEQLSSSSVINWSLTKKEALEALISKWAFDTRKDFKVTTLLLAHSNDEVRVLNEMVRTIKKERGELSGKEFACETSLGKVYLSLGDRIEFRKNDKGLGVTNGLTGTLIEATEKKFVIAIKEDGGKSRVVTFNPEKYYSYQPGYASTHYRSQGKTVDKAYVLHSQALNKRLFYVGLTRHFHQVYYFVSKDQAYCLSDLKRQALRDNIKENTLTFTTQQEMRLQSKRVQKEEEIQQLKGSDSFVQQIKGYGLDVVNLVKTKATQALEGWRDRTPSAEFFKPPATEKSIRARVEEVNSELDAKPDLKTILLQERSRKELPLKGSNAGHLRQFKTPEQHFEKACEMRKVQWVAFDPKKQEVLRSYFSIAEQAATLKTVVDFETAESSRESLPHSRVKEWQIACGERNVAAQILMQKISFEELNGFLGKKIVKLITDQAIRYEDTLERSQTISFSSIEEELKKNIEPLLSRIFPEGPHQKNRNEFRFGTKGSLSVSYSGEKIGQFYDFERQEGGGVLKLVQRELGFGRLEALEWAKDFLGIVKDVQVPRAFQKLTKEVSTPQDWVSVKADPLFPAPALKDLPGKKLHLYFDEVARHAYCDENRNLLYYRLRLQDKKDPTKKLTPPLSYGHWKSHPGQFGWELKGFGEGKRVLYNLPDLKEQSLVPVLIVEGEKTADQAHTKFPHNSFVFITWSGGAGAARHADWAPLVGRSVFVWPDNDKSGVRAGEDVCRELKKVGVKSLQMVDPVLLSKSFPEKWDLADPLPLNMERDLLKKLLQGAIQKGIDPQQVIYRVSSLYKDDALDRIRVNEILWRVDERLRPDLEQRGHRKVDEVILNETARILLQQEEGSKKHGDWACWQAMVHEARYGKIPTEQEMKKIVEVIQKFEAPGDQRDRSLRLGMDQAITHACEKIDAGYAFSIKKRDQEVVADSQKLTRQIEQLQSIEKMIHPHQKGQDKFLEPEIK